MRLHTRLLSNEEPKPSLCDCTCHDNVVPLSCVGSCCEHAHVLRKDIPVRFDTFNKYNINNNGGEQ